MRFVRPSDLAAMERLVESVRQAQPTYPDVGATMAGGQPEGYHYHQHETILGHGFEAFGRAVRGLKAWEAHRGPGIRIFPKGQDITTGATVVVTLGSARVALAAPCRIVSVIDQETRWGFAYGTLPGHPEQGEEAFVVSLAPDGTVRFQIDAFSRPADPIVRLSGAIGRALQKGGTKGYLRSLRRYVDHADR
jgi:uncharacterized protein (UPF0548 family)